MKKTLIGTTALLTLVACIHATPAEPVNERRARPSPDWVTSGVMYQIQPRAFTAEGTLKAATARLPKIAEIGVSIIYLCPVFVSDDDPECYDAIDPLVEIASQTDPAVYGPALDGLRRIADPDKTDIPRLVKLLLRTGPGRHRDEVERTILIVCDKLPATADRSELVRAALARADRSDSEQG